MFREHYPGTRLAVESDSGAAVLAYEIECPEALLLCASWALFGCCMRCRRRGIWLRVIDAVAVWALGRLLEGED